MICERCSTPLLQTQGRFCSRACANATGRVYDRRCSDCGRPLTRSQHWKRVTYCSRACADANQPTPMQECMLDLFHQNRDWFLTVSDLAIWLYGFDDPAEQTLVRTTLSRLVQRGYRFERRAPVWLRCHGRRRAYRLVTESSASRLEMAA